MPPLSLTPPGSPQHDDGCRWHRTKDGLFFLWLFGPLTTWRAGTARPSSHERIADPAHHRKGRFDALTIRYCSTHRPPAHTTTIAKAPLCCDCSANIDMRNMLPGVVVALLIGTQTSPKPKPRTPVHPLLYMYLSLNKVCGLDGLATLVGLNSFD